MKSYLVLSILSIVIISSCKKKDTDEPATLNPLDGKYRLEGTLTDFKEPAFVWPGDSFLYSLKTLSATQVSLISEDLGFEGHLLKNGINTTFYGTFGLKVSFDATTNKITAVSNSFGEPSANGRSAELDSTGINIWDPVTKNIKIKYWMDEEGFAGHRTSFDETWVYIGPR